MNSRCASRDRSLVCRNVAADHGPQTRGSRRVSVIFFLVALFGVLLNATGWGTCPFEESMWCRLLYHRQRLGSAKAKVLCGVEKDLPFWERQTEFTYPLFALAAPSFTDRRLMPPQSVNAAAGGNISCANSTNGCSTHTKTYQIRGDRANTTTISYAKTESQSLKSATAHSITYIARTKTNNRTPAITSTQSSRTRGQWQTSTATLLNVLTPSKTGNRTSTKDLVMSATADSTPSRSSLKESFVTPTFSSAGSVSTSLESQRTSTDMLSSTLHSSFSASRSRNTRTRSGRSMSGRTFSSTLSKPSSSSSQTRTLSVTLSTTVSITTSTNAAFTSTGTLSFPSATLSKKSVSLSDSKATRTFTQSLSHSQSISGYTPSNTMSLARTRGTLSDTISPVASESKTHYITESVEVSRSASMSRTAPLFSRPTPPCGLHALSHLVYFTPSCSLIKVITTADDASVARNGEPMVSMFAVGSYTTSSGNYPTPVTTQISSLFSHTASGCTSGRVPVEARSWLVPLRSGFPSASALALATSSSTSAFSVNNAFYRKSSVIAASSTAKVTRTVLSQQTIGGRVRYVPSASQQSEGTITASLLQLLPNAQSDPATAAAATGQQTSAFRNITLVTFLRGQMRKINGEDGFEAVPDSISRLPSDGFRDDFSESKAQPSQLFASVSPQVPFEVENLGAFGFITFRPRYWAREREVSEQIWLQRQAMGLTDAYLPKDNIVRDSSFSLQRRSSYSSQQTPFLKRNSEPLLDAATAGPISEEEVDLPGYSSETQPTSRIVFFHDAEAANETTATPPSSGVTAAPSTSVTLTTPMTPATSSPPPRTTEAASSETVSQSLTPAFGVFFSLPRKDARSEELFYNINTTTTSASGLPPPSSPPLSLFSNSYSKSRKQRQEKFEDNGRLWLRFLDFVFDTSVVQAVVGGQRMSSGVRAVHPRNVGGDVTTEAANWGFDVEAEDLILRGGSKESFGSKRSGGGALSANYSSPFTASQRSLLATVHNGNVLYQQRVRYAFSRDRPGAWEGRRSTTGSSSNSDGGSGCGSYCLPPLPPPLLDAFIFGEPSGRLSATDILRIDMERVEESEGEGDDLLTPEEKTTEAPNGANTSGGTRRGLRMAANEADSWDTYAKLPIESVYRRLQRYTAIRFVVRLPTAPGPYRGLYRFSTTASNGGGDSVGTAAEKATRNFLAISPQPAIFLTADSPFGACANYDQNLLLTAEMDPKGKSGGGALMSREASFLSLMLQMNPLSPAIDLSSDGIKEIIASGTREGSSSSAGGGTTGKQQNQLFSVDKSLLASLFLGSELHPLSYGGVSSTSSTQPQVVEDIQGLISVKQQSRRGVFEGMGAKMDATLPKANVKATKGNANDYGAELRMDEGQHMLYPRDRRVLAVKVQNHGAKPNDSDIEEIENELGAHSLARRLLEVSNAKSEEQNSNPNLSFNLLADNSSATLTSALPPSSSTGELSTTSSAFESSTTSQSTIATSDTIVTTTSSSTTTTENGGTTTPPPQTSTALTTTSTPPPATSSTSAATTATATTSTAPSSSTAAPITDATVSVSRNEEDYLLRSLLSASVLTASPMTFPYPPTFEAYRLAIYYYLSLPVSGSSARAPSAGVRGFSVGLRVPSAAELTALIKELDGTTTDPYFSFSAAAEESSVSDQDTLNGIVEGAAIPLSSIAVAVAASIGGLFSPSAAIQTAMVSGLQRTILCTPRDLAPPVGGPTRISASYLVSSAFPSSVTMMDSPLIPLFYLGGGLSGAADDSQARAAGDRDALLAKTASALANKQKSWIEEAQKAGVIGTGSSGGYSLPSEMEQQLLWTLWSSSAASGSLPRERPFNPNNLIYHRSALLGNLIYLVFMTLLFLLTGKIFQVIRRRGEAFRNVCWPNHYWRDVMTMLGWPSILWLPIAIVAHGTVAVSVTIVHYYAIVLQYHAAKVVLGADQVLGGANGEGFSVSRVASSLMESLFYALELSSSSSSSQQSGGGGDEGPVSGEGSVLSVFSRSVVANHFTFTVAATAGGGGGADDGATTGGSGGEALYYYSYNLANAPLDLCLAAISLFIALVMIIVFFSCVCNLRVAADIQGNISDSSESEDENSGDGDTNETDYFTSLQTKRKGIFKRGTRRRGCCLFCCCCCNSRSSPIVVEDFEDEQRTKKHVLNRMRGVYRARRAEKEAAERKQMRNNAGVDDDAPRASSLPEPSSSADPQSSVATDEADKLISFPAMTLLPREHLEEAVLTQNWATEKLFYLVALRHQSVHRRRLALESALLRERYEAKRAAEERRKVLLAAKAIVSARTAERAAKAERRALAVKRKEERREARRQKKLELSVEDGVAAKDGAEEKKGAVRSSPDEEERPEEPPKAKRSSSPSLASSSSSFSFESSEFSEAEENPRSDANNRFNDAALEQRLGAILFGDHDAKGSNETRQLNRRKEDRGAHFDDDGLIDDKGDGIGGVVGEVGMPAIKLASSSTKRQLIEDIKSEGDAEVSDELPTKYSAADELFREVFGDMASFDDIKDDDSLFGTDVSDDEESRGYASNHQKEKSSTTAEKKKSGGGDNKEAKEGGKGDTEEEAVVAEWLRRNQEAKERWKRFGDGEEEGDGSDESDAVKSQLSGFSQSEGSNRGELGAEEEEEDPFAELRDEDETSPNNEEDSVKVGEEEMSGGDELRADRESSQTPPPLPNREAEALSSPANPSVSFLSQEGSASAPPRRENTTLSLSHSLQKGTQNKRGFLDISAFDATGKHGKEGATTTVTAAAAASNSEADPAGKKGKGVFVGIRNAQSIVASGMGKALDGASALVRSSASAASRATRRAYISASSAAGYVANRSEAQALARFVRYWFAKESEWVMVPRNSVTRRVGLRFARIVEDPEAFEQLLAKAIRDETKRHAREVLKMRLEIAVSSSTAKEGPAASKNKTREDKESSKTARGLRREKEESSSPHEDVDEVLAEAEALAEHIMSEDISGGGQEVDKALNRVLKDIKSNADDVGRGAAEKKKSSSGGKREGSKSDGKGSRSKSKPPPSSSNPDNEGLSLEEKRLRRLANKKAAEEAAEREELKKAPPPLPSLALEHIIAFHKRRNTFIIEQLFRPHRHSAISRWILRHQHILSHVRWRFFEPTLMLIGGIGLGILDGIIITSDVVCQTRAILYMLLLLILLVLTVVLRVHLIRLQWVLFIFALSCAFVASVFAIALSFGPPASADGGFTPEKLLIVFGFAISMAFLACIFLFVFHGVILTLSGVRLFFSTIELNTRRNAAIKDSDRRRFEALALVVREHASTKAAAAMTMRMTSPSSSTEMGLRTHEGDDRDHSLRTRKGTLRKSGGVTVGSFSNKSVNEDDGSLFPLEVHDFPDKADFTSSDDDDHAIVRTDYKIRKYFRDEGLRYRAMLMKHQRQFMEKERDKRLQEAEKGKKEAKARLARRRKEIEKQREKEAITIFEKRMKNKKTSSEEDESKSKSLSASDKKEIERIRKKLSEEDKVKFEAKESKIDKEFSVPPLPPMPSFENGGLTDHYDLMRQYVRSTKTVLSAVDLCEIVIPKKAVVVEESKASVSGVGGGVYSPPFSSVGVPPRSSLSANPPPPPPNNITCTRFLNAYRQRTLDQKQFLLYRPEKTDAAQQRSANLSSRFSPSSLPLTASPTFYTQDEYSDKTLFYQPPSPPLGCNVDPLGEGRKPKKTNDADSVAAGGKSTTTVNTAAKDFFDVDRYGESVLSSPSRGAVRHLETAREGTSAAPNSLRFPNSNSTSQFTHHSLFPPLSNASPSIISALEMKAAGSSSAGGNYDALSSFPALYPPNQILSVYDNPDELLLAAEEHHRRQKKAERERKRQSEKEAERKGTKENDTKGSKRRRDDKRNTNGNADFADYASALLGDHNNNDDDNDDDGVVYSLQDLLKRSEADEVEMSVFLPPPPTKIPVLPHSFSFSSSSPPRTQRIMSSVTPLRELSPEERAIGGNEEGIPTLQQEEHERGKADESIANSRVADVSASVVEEESVLVRDPTSHARVQIDFNAEEERKLGRLRARRKHEEAQEATVRKLEEAVVASSGAVGDGGYTALNPTRRGLRVLLANSRARSSDREEKSGGETEIAPSNSKDKANNDDGNTKDGKHIDTEMYNDI